MAMRYDTTVAANGELLAWQPQAPFRDESSREAMRGVETEPHVSSSILAVASPFVHEQETFGPTHPELQFTNQLLSELHDPEFDVAVYELVHELSSSVVTRMASEVGDARAYDLRVERSLGERLLPIARVYHEQLEELEAQLLPLDTPSLSETELGVLVERTPAPTTTSGPAFEFFLKKLWDKAKKVVKGAAKVLKNVALKPLFAGLKRLIQPLLRKVLALAMDKIPEKYRPLADKLAQKFGIKKTTSKGAIAPATPIAEPAAAGASANSPDPSDAPAAAATASAEPSAAGAVAPTEPTTAPVADVQSEFNDGLAELLLAKDDAQRESELSEQEAVALRPAADPIGELEQERARFVRRLVSLQEGEDPQPALEQFIPAVFAVVKLGLKLIGRKRVVSFLGKLLGTLIGPLVGKPLAQPLGSAIADVGLKLLGFELPSAASAEVAAQAIAEVVEGTVRRIAAAPAYVHDNESLLESYALDAFETEAAANFPPSLIRPELHEAPGVDAMWVTLPRQGRPYFKKFSRPFDIQLTKPIAATIHGFHGRTLSAFLRDVLHAEFPIRARVHVYQLLTGGRLTHIAQYDHAPGLGEASAYRLLQPLTNHAALALLQHPKLGTPFPDAPTPLHAMVGQRFYYLELDRNGARVPPPGSLRELGEASHFRAHVDFPRGQIRVRLHLGEPAAQRVASELRKTRSGQTLVHRLRQLFTAEAAHLASARNEDVLRVTTDTPDAPDRTSSATSSRDDERRGLRRQLGETLVEWTWVRLAEFAARSLDDFLRATESTDNGVTLLITFANPPHLGALQHAFRYGRRGSGDAWPPRVTPAASLRIFAGSQAD